MNHTDIDNLVHNKKFSHECETPEVIETHISWVFLCEEFAYKIKKPVKFDDIDYSTLNKRKFYCEQELQLNKRFAPEVYLDVVPVTNLSGEFTVEADGHVADYAVKMKMLPQRLRMDKMLEAHEVKVPQIQAIAERLADFHSHAPISETADLLLLKEDFIEIVDQVSGMNASLVNDLEKALKKAHRLIDNHSETFRRRIDNGYNRDCHGDLHAQNIFLVDPPVIFDCIEYSERLRQIDVLSDVAFICMDMEYYGHEGLSDAFFEYYNHVFPIAGDGADKELYRLYKAYRAGVRAKVNAIMHTSEISQDDFDSKEVVNRYIKMMMSYLEKL